MVFEHQTRREFCAHACRAASLAALGATLQGCGSSNPNGPSQAPALPVLTASQTNGAIVLTVDAASPLAAVGSAALVQTGNGFVLVAHTGQDAFAALSATCTHQACTIAGYANQNFVCPCHGSRFDTSGRVLSGPARTALPQFHAQFASGVLTITA